MERLSGGKRRSKSQVIGEAGEGLFMGWAAKHRLSATKPQNDYGIDFFCHVFRPGGLGGGQRLSGAVLAVQVRSTSAKAGTQRVKLDRDDAQAALAADVPYLLVGVDVTKERVYFRFLDDALMVKLQSFLSGGKKSLSWPLNKMDTGDEAFFERLDEVCRPAHQHRLRIARAKLAVAATAPGSEVSFVQTDGFGIAHVRMPLITAAFDVPAAAQPDAARIVFEQGQIPKNDVRFPPHAAIASLFELVDGSIVLEGPIERPVPLTVRAPGHAPVTVTASLRAIGDEVGFVLRCGLYLRFSAPRRQGDILVHEFDHGIAVSDVVPLWEVPEELDFLKLLVEGATVGREGGQGIPIDHWGQLRLLGPALQRIEKVMSHFMLPTDRLRLADVVDPSFQIGASVAAAFVDGASVEQIVPGFLFEAALRGAEPRASGWGPCNFALPLVMNLGASGLVVWIRGMGSVYLVDGQVCGFRAEKQEQWWFEKMDQPFPGVNRPQLWVHKNWPGVPLEAAAGSVELPAHDDELPFAATIVPATGAGPAACF